MITRLFNHAHALFQTADDESMQPEAAVCASVDEGGIIVLEQEGRYIVINRASINEMCKLLRKLHDIGFEK